MTISGLLDEARCVLDGRFEGCINGYVTVVKLDLEAREVIKRLPTCRPQKLQQRRLWPPARIAVAHGISRPDILKRGLLLP